LLLAESLRQCFEHHGDDGLLVEVISVGQEALALSPDSHPNWAMSCGNLAVSLKTCYERTGDVGLLDKAIDLQH
jgi:hypothetical protein